jgi:DNA replication protein DnaC
MTEPSSHGHPATSHAELRAQATELRLHGLLAHCDELMGQPQTEQRVRQWPGWESTERAHRSLERRLREAHLGHFKPLADFDWLWPKECDRQAIEELMSLQFMADASSVVLIGPNGVVKSMIAANLGYQAVLQGHTVIVCAT